jgi:hypothetical protein
MPLLPLALPAQSQKGEYEHSGIAAIINGYAIPGGSEQRAQLKIRAASGLDDVATLSGASSGVRGMLEVDGLVYTVAGRTLYQVDADGNATLIGGIPSDGYVGMDRNQRAAGVQVIIVCDGRAWVVTGGTQTLLSDPDLQSPIDVCVINRSAIFANSRGRMFRSEIDDASSVDGLDVAEAESAPDGLIRVVAKNSDLIAIGSRSTEIWTDVGGEAFGFSRANVINIGAIGPRSVVKTTVLSQVVTDSVAWCATNHEGRFAGVVLLSGYTPQKISTPYIDTLIDKVADKDSITACSWVERGHAMIAWRLPDTTVVYDTSTGLWHERQSRSSTGGVITWRVGYTAVLGGRVLAGDAIDAKLYWLDPDVADEAGDEMVMTIRTPPLNVFPARAQVNKLHLDVVPGVGLVTGATQDVAPEIMMRWSQDNKTWSAARSRLLGRQGRDATEVSWSRIGTLRSATFEFSVSAAVVREILQARWEGEATKV